MHSSAFEKEEGKMSRGLDNPFPGLGSASCENIQYSEVSKEYSSGARYVGQVQGNKKAGRGIFTWPNGAKYDGEFVDNVRHGRGCQTWPDGSSYEGKFCQDMRHGQGKHSWANGESYEGIFYRDHRHGSGKYTWSDNSSYSGTFYMDSKEGYGCFTFSDGRKFQGLYKQDEREGPGVMTYPDGTQDVGLWHRDNLSRLCSNVEGAFTMKDHPEFEYYPEEHKLYISADSISNRRDVIADVLQPPDMFDYEKVNIGSRSDQLFQGGLRQNSVASDVKSCHDEFNKSVQGSRSSSAILQQRDCSNATPESRTPPDKVSSRPASESSRIRTTSSRTKTGKQSANSARRSEHSRGQTLGALEENPGILAWNKTPSSVEMQKHVVRHSMSQHRAGFDVEAIISGNREGFGPKGQLEEAAERFLKAAASGDVKLMSDFLHKGKVYVDVADRSGHTALLAAAVNWHQDVINCLLDNGADVNKLNDEGVSALAACHVFFYPVHRFKYNIAERYLDRPSQFSTEPKYDVNDAVRGILSTAGKKKTHAPVERKQTSTLDAKHIQKIRDEYVGDRLEQVSGRQIEGQEPMTDRQEQVAEEEAEGENQTIEKQTNAREQIATDGNRAENVRNNEREDSSRSRSSEGRKLGTLKIKRTVRINVEQLLDLGPAPETTPSVKTCNSDVESTSSGDIDDFESYNTAHSYPIDVPDQLIDRCATVLSTNEMVVGRSRTSTADLKTVGTARRLAMEKAHHQLMERTIRLLLRRGADPNASLVPMPVLFFAVKAADVDAVKTLLMKGASTSSTLSEKKGGLTALHIAAAIPGEEGVQITSLLLDALADPDARAAEDDSFLNTNLQDEWIKDPISEEAKKILGGRTPLHIACARDDNYKNACNVVHLLLDHHANPNLLCNGHSPLALAIRSGNDLAVDELLSYKADPCLPLTHGVGSALCLASSTEYEHRRTPDGRINLIDKLIAAGADILAPIPIGPKRLIGTAVDYAYHLYNLDRRIAHMPYHALTPAERETFNARRRLLAHLGDIIRQKAIEKEKQRLQEEERLGRRSRSPSPNFIYTGAGASLPQSIMKQHKATDSKVSFSTQDDVRKPLFKYCYECGRSVGVRLAACTRCKEVFYCSKACKVKAWNARHKDECIRIKGASPVMSKYDKRIDSPTPATDADKGRHGNVKALNKGDPRVKDMSAEGQGSTKYHKEEPEHEYPQIDKFNQMHDNDAENDQITSASREGQVGVNEHENTRTSGDKYRVRLPRQDQTKADRYQRSKGHVASSGSVPDKTEKIENLKTQATNKLNGKHLKQKESRMIKKQVPFKGRSISADYRRDGRGPLTVVLPNGRLVTAPLQCHLPGQQPCTMILPNGKLIYVDNYSFV